MSTQTPSATMTSRERVLTAFNRAEPDRVPVNYHGNPGVHTALMKHFHIDPSRPHAFLELQDCVDSDFRIIDARYVGPELFEQVPERRVDPIRGVHTKWVPNASGGYWDFCDFPLRDADEETMANWPMPDPDDFAYDEIPDMCKAMGTRCLHVGDPGFCDVINQGGTLRSMEQVFMDIQIDNPAFWIFTDRRLEWTMEVARRTIEAARGRIDFLWMGEDLGTQAGPIISPDVYRQHIKPRHQRVVDMARSFDLPVMIHSCGSSSWAYEDFIEMGIQVVDTLQPEAAHMHPRELKARFGSRLAFHGCISTAGVLAFGTPADVEANVRETLEIMMPGGGYCLAPTHWIQENSPVENVLALYDAARRYGVY